MTRPPPANCGFDKKGNIRAVQIKLYKLTKITQVAQKIQLGVPKFYDTKRTGSGHLNMAITTITMALVIMKTTKRMTMMTIIITMSKVYSNPNEHEDDINHN